MFKIRVTTNMASTTRCELLTKGQIGAQVQFMFNDHWADMKKTAVFKRCGKTIDVVDSEWNGDIVTVPSEMTEEAGLQVYVGVYGVSEDGKRITPTLYAPLGAVALGADPNGDPSTDPTLPVWAQIQAQIGDLADLTTEAKDTLVAAINEAARTGGAGSMDLRVADGYVQYSTDGGMTWTNLIAMAELKGADGITPTIGSNGNWYLGNTDTGKPSRGEKGDEGQPGKDGADGKSAYQYAQEGGYTGTETAFAEKLAQEQLTGTTGTLTPTQVYEAVSAGIPVKVQYTDSTFGLISFTAFNVSESLNVIASQIIAYFNGLYILYELYGDKSSNAWGTSFTALAEKTDIPATLPNPNALTFTGAVNATYDGSAPLSVEIPSGGGGVSIPLLYDLTTSEEVEWIDTGDNVFLVKNFLFVELVSVATATNESDGSGSASMYPLQSGAMQCPWNNQVVARTISALMPKTYTKVFRAFCFRGDGGHWTSITSIRNDVNTESTTPAMVSMRFEGTSDQPMRGLIIGKAFASNTNVFGVGSRLRVWGV